MAKRTAGTASVGGVRSQPVAVPPHNGAEGGVGAAAAATPAQPPSATTPAANAGSSGPAIHIVIATDSHANQNRGLAALLRSIVSNTAARERLAFHIISTAGGESGRRSVQAELSCYGFPPASSSQGSGLASTDTTGLGSSALGGSGDQPMPPVDVVAFDDSVLQGKIRVQNSVGEVGNLASSANYARFYMQDLFPAVDKAIWLDIDVVVQVCMRGSGGVGC